ncbi:hypothetical protein [Nonlabens agnitus]|uniref:Uncharacterized protein n=1 Tax=Nonlabens agnitus TaxID=870484 RepID=A0A2S9WXB0_9FLAO|nr:hypothetical protein [Nonlabens agnitus]PRP68112.1 hypothetical protein BST86_13955 [Nonlabens agnitus]
MDEGLKLFTDDELTSANEFDFSVDFVAIYSTMTNGVADHAGLFICFDEKQYAFHFDSQNVVLVEITGKEETLNQLHIKVLDIIFEEEVPAFLTHCEILLKKGISPLFGFAFSDSYYDSVTKESFLKNAKFDITTCVGFCIKVIRGHLYNNQEYLKLEDWGFESLLTLKPLRLERMKRYLRSYASLHSISIEDLYNDSDLKRILPSELLSSGYFIELPISKNSTDLIKPLIEKYMIDRNVA